MLTVVTALVVIATAKANIQDSSGACNVDKHSLNNVKDHMCDGDSREIITVTYASRCECDDLLPQKDTQHQPKIGWTNAREVRLFIIL